MLTFLLPYILHTFTLLIYQPYQNCSKLEHANIVWDDCADYLKERLENIQLTFARIVTGAKRGTSHQLLYNELSWPTLADRRTVAKLKFMHKLLHNNVPEYLTDVLPFTDCGNANYNLRNKDDVQQYATRTEKFRKSIVPDCIRKWNALPLTIRSIHSYPDFVKEISCKSTQNFYIMVSLGKHL